MGLMPDYANGIETITFTHLSPSASSSPSNLHSIMSNWDELPCPRCQALNFIVFNDRMQVEVECKGCAELVVFVRDPWAHGSYLERLRQHRENSPGKPL
jgi:hypothetical protein